MRNVIDDRLYKSWNQLYSGREYRGNNTLPFKRNKKPWILSKGRKNAFYTITDNDVQTFARFTRAFSGHGPTGEYSLRFRQHDPQASPKCGGCHFPLQSRTHILTECPKYRAKYTSTELTPFIDNTVAEVINFLKRNPTAFTFEDIVLVDPP
ncbi:hypothetical protein AX17_002519 [Amanita inopinata Kibby_2008]|nr:hypothetical protein AX17_002519 [Amanita inopinata Kibby_2008]